MNKTDIQLMDAEVVEMETGVVYDKMAMRFTRPLTIEEADYELKKLWKIRDWVQFYIGDLLNHAEALGETYAQLVDETRYSAGTLQNFKWVAGKVRPNARCPELNFSHHVAVAPLNPRSQDTWLQVAIGQKLSAPELNRAIKDTRIGEKSKPIHMINAMCPECGHCFEVEKGYKGGGHERDQ